MSYKSQELKDLEQYAKSLDILAKNNVKDVFLNRNHKHASIVLSKILKYSKNSFVVFDDDLRGDIVNHDEVVSFKDSLINFISRDGNVKIIISDKTDYDNKNLVFFFRIINKLYPKNVSIKLASSEFKDSMRSIYGEKINYALGDNNKYRLEKFGNNSTEAKARIAEGSFNNTEVPSKLLKVVDEYYNTCSEYFNN